MIRTLLIAMEAVRVHLDFQRSCENIIFIVIVYTKQDARHKGLNVTFLLIHSDFLVWSTSLLLKLSRPVGIQTVVWLF